MPIPTYDDLVVTRTPDDGSITISDPPTHIGIAAAVLACVDPTIVTVNNDGLLTIHATDRQVTYRPVAFEHHGHGPVVIVCERVDPCTCPPAQIVGSGGDTIDQDNDPDCPQHGDRKISR